MKRVLHVIDNLAAEDGGSTQFLDHVLTQFERLSISDVDVLVLNKISEPFTTRKQCIFFAGTKYRYLSIFLWCLFNLRRFDAIVLHGVVSVSTLCVVFCRLFIKSPPVFICPHGSLISRSFNLEVVRFLVLLGVWINKIFHQPTFAVFASELEATRSGKKHLFFKKWWVVTPFYTICTPNLQRSECPSDVIMMGMACRFDKLKRIDFVLEVLIELRNRGFAAELIIYGEPVGPVKRMIDQFIQNSAISDFVHIRGLVEHKILFKKLGELTVGLIPSTYESFGYSVLDFLACGVPVVCSPNVGSLEVLNQIESISESDLNVSEWADAIIELARQPTRPKVQIDEVVLRQNDESAKKWIEILA